MFVVSQGSTLQKTPPRVTSMCTASVEAQAAQAIKTNHVTFATGNPLGICLARFALRVLML